ncbi:MAG: REP-associated tyrosine transposase [Candidatus Binatia bacterium]
MARPLRINYPGAFYHVTCRGNERRDIFADDRDRSAFLDKLRTSMGIYEVRVHAYVLMSNHFHMIVETPKGNLSEFMRHFNISYTAGYNRRHNRVGHLYQGRFKAILIDADDYLLELSRYVHLNPVRLGTYKSKDAGEKIKDVERYRWSSLSGYLNTSKRQSWITYDTVFSCVGESRSKYREFVIDGIRRGYDTPWEEVKGQAVLGGEDFVERIKGRRKSLGSRREQPGVRQLEAIDPAAVLKKVARYFQLPERQLTGKRTGRRDERGVALELMYRLGGTSQARIGDLMGLDYTAVSRERKRLRDRIESDMRLKKRLREIEALVLS